MHRLILSVLITFSLAIFMSCAGPEAISEEEVSDAPKPEESQYPSWYGNQKVVNTDSVIYAYATAIDDDSASAVSKAEQWAERELKNSVSDKLEEVRSDANVEKGSQSGLDSSQFLLALRKADNAVSSVIDTENTEVRTVEGYDSYRSFAGVVVPKDELIEQIGKRLASYEQAWNAMKESEAFEGF